VREDVVQPPSPLAPVRTRPPSTRNSIARKGDRGRLLVDDEIAGHGQSTTAPDAERQAQAHLGRNGRPALRDIDGHPTGYPAWVEYLDQKECSEAGTRTPTTALRSTSTLGSLPHPQDQYLSPCGPKVADALLLSENLSAASKSPERQVEIQSPGKATIRSEQATILGTDDQQFTYGHHDCADPVSADDGPSSDALLALDGGGTEVAESEVDQRNDQRSSLARHTRDPSGHRLSRRDKKFYSLDPGLSDLASLVCTFDRAGKSLLASDVDASSMWPRSETGDDGQASGIAHASARASSRGSTVTGASVPSISGPKEDSATKPCQLAGRIERHGCPPLRVDTRREAPDGGSICNLWSARSATPLLAPKPISPAKELRVKNSIPQLMKALPPLPGDSADSSLVSPDASEVEFEIPTRYSPINLSAFSSSPRSTSRDEPHTMDLDEHFQRSLDETQPEPKSPRFKVRMKHSTSGSQGTMESRPWNRDKNYPWTEHTPDIRLASIGTDSPRHLLGKSRLKLKVSNVLTTDCDEGLGTVKRRTTGEKSATISEITLQHPRDLFETPVTGFHLFPRPPTPPPTRESTLTSANIGTRPNSLYHLTPLDSIILDRGITGHAGRGASLDTHLQAAGVPRLSAGESPSDQGTLHSEKDRFKRRKALKKKFSNLKRKLSRVHLVESERSHDDVANDLQASGAGLTTSSLSAQVSADPLGQMVAKTTSIDSGGTKGLGSSRLRQKLSRWMRGARKVVHACVRKRRRPLPRHRDDAGT